MVAVSGRIYAWVSQQSLHDSELTELRSPAQSTAPVFRGVNSWVREQQLNDGEVAMLRSDHQWVVDGDIVKACRRIHTRMGEQRLHHSHVAVPGG